MNVSTTKEADVMCKDLICQEVPAWGFPDLDALWVKVEDALKFDFSTTKEEDLKGMTILKEVFEEACWAALEDGDPDFASTYVDYKRLWERLCEVLGVEV